MSGEKSFAIGHSRDEHTGDSGPRSHRKRSSYSPAGGGGGGVASFGRRFRWNRYAIAVVSHPWTGLSLLSESCQAMLSWAVTGPKVRKASNGEYYEKFLFVYNHSKDFPLLGWVLNLLERGKTPSYIISHYGCPASDGRPTVSSAIAFAYDGTAR